MRLSTKARYGLRALVHLAHRDHASIQAIADHEGIAPRYLEEIIGDLRRAGFVVGKRGPRGGYRLARPSGEIALAEVLEALTGPSSESQAPSSPDEIARLVERSVDQVLQAALGDLRLEQLLHEAQDQHRRSAANYVI